MLTITESAKQLLKEILKTHSDDSNKGIRLVLESPGQLSLALGTEEKDDQVIEHEGAKVLLVSKELMPVVEGVTLDVEDTANGPKVVALKEKTE
jgi:Fe-S cluster assembly iron-binding protein IscA